MPTDPATIDPNLIAAGGETIAITYRDGRAATVKVRLLEMEHLMDFVTVLADEAALAELVCAQDPGWAKTLSLDSLLTIAEKAQALNFTNARRYLERRASLKSSLEPLELRLLPLSPSATSAPASV